MTNLSASLSQALAFHQAGQFQEARTLYGQILEQEPNHPEALHLFGVLAYQIGSPETAIELIQKAISLRSDVPPTFHNSLGTALCIQGRFQEAATHFQRALAINPTFDEALINWGNALQSQGLLEAAVEKFQEALQVNPTSPEAHNNLGNVLRDLGRLQEAEGSYRHALSLSPQYLEAYYNLSCVLQDLGKLSEALFAVNQALDGAPDFAEGYLQRGAVQEAQGDLNAAVLSYQEALQLAPDLADAYNDLGNVLQAQGNWDAALAAFQESIILQPDFPQAHHNLGVLYQKQGKFAEAKASYEEALRLKPDLASAYRNLGSIAQEAGQMEEAIGYFEKTVEADPSYVTAYNDQGYAYYLQGKIETARTRYRKACRLKPEQQLWELRTETLCPVMMDSHADIAETRQRIEATLDRFLDQPLHFELEELLTVGCEPSFYLPYHGENDLGIKSKFGDLFHAAFQRLYPTLMAPSRSSSSDLPHLGFLVTAGHEKGFGMLLGGILDQLPRQEFKLTICCSPRGIATLSAYLKNADGIHFAPFPEGLLATIEALKAQGFDALFYYEVGTDPLSYFLPYFRLAPVQCTSFGYPVTTGIPNMDYFLSSDLWEPPEGEAYYRETLTRFNTLPVYYYPPQAPASLKTREELGLSVNAHLYACPQSLFKFHPDMDTVFRSILEQDPKGQILLVEGSFGHWQNLLEERFSRTLPHVQDRIRILPRLSPKDFFNVLAVSDVALDPLHYGGGNTSLEGFHMGVPLVSLPSPYLRCRLTDGFYRKMGISDCTAATMEDYSNLAVRIGTDPAYQQTLREKIIAAKPVLFEDSLLIPELSTFFHQAIEKAKG